MILRTTTQTETTNNRTQETQTQTKTKMKDNPPKTAKTTEIVKTLRTQVSKELPRTPPTEPTCPPPTTIEAMLKIKDHKSKGTMIVPTTTPTPGENQVQDHQVLQVLQEKWKIQAE